MPAGVRIIHLWTRFHDPDSLLTALEKADAETFFAEPGVRAAAVVFDFALVMFIAYQLLNEISGKLYVTDIDARLVIALALLAYFTGSWLSPMRATPVQFLFGMRVLDQSGQKLTFARALLRSVLVVAMVGGTLMLLAVPGSRFFGAVALVSFALAYLAALTPNRQAMPDLLARTVVVNRVVLKSPEKLEQLRQHVTENDPATRKLRRPTIPSMIGNAIVLAVPFMVLVTFAQVSNDMELRHRTSYAIEGTAGLR